MNENFDRVFNKFNGVMNGFNAMMNNMYNPNDNMNWISFNMGNDYKNEPFILYNDVVENDKEKMNVFINSNLATVEKSIMFKLENGSLVYEFNKVLNRDLLIKMLPTSLIDNSKPFLCVPEIVSIVNLLKDEDSVRVELGVVNKDTTVISNSVIKLFTGKQFKEMVNGKINKNKKDDKNESKSEKSEKSDKKTTNADVLKEIKFGNEVNNYNMVDVLERVYVDVDYETHTPIKTIMCLYPREKGNEISEQRFSHVDDKTISNLSKKFKTIVDANDMEDTITTYTMCRMGSLDFITHEHEQSLASKELVSILCLLAVLYDFKSNPRYETTSSIVLKTLSCLGKCIKLSNSEIIKEYVDIILNYYLEAFALNKPNHIYQYRMIFPNSEDIMGAIAYDSNGNRI